MILAYKEVRMSGKKAVRCIGVTVLLLLTTVFVWAGGRRETPVSKVGEPVEIVFATHEPYDTYAKLVMEELRKKGANFTLKVVSLPTNEYESTVVVQLAGGAEYDLFTTENVQHYELLAGRGVGVELDPFVARDGIDVSAYGPLYEGLKLNGSVYGLPYWKTSWVLFYNKDLFDKRGEPYPKSNMSLEEYSAMAARMTWGEGSNKVYGAFVQDWPVCWFGWGVQAGGTLIDEDLTPFRNALRFVVDLQNAGSAMRYNEIVSTRTHYRALMESGRLATHIMGTWHIKQLMDSQASGVAKFSWDIAAAPLAPGAAPFSTWGVAQAVMINARSKKQEAAWEFAKAFSGEIGALVFASQGEEHSYASEAVRSEYIRRFEGLDPKNIGLISRLKTYMEVPAVPGINVVENIYDQESQLVFAGEQTVDKAIEVIAKRIREEFDR
jgi:multiple sugar transport system substrate-binding protein